MQWKALLKRKWIAIAGSVLLIIITTRNLSNYYMIHVGGDEFGYWANAAYWSGENWSSLMENIPYYSWGYSVLLFMITRLPIEMTAAYQVAIALNVLMLVIIYRLTSYSLCLWFPEVKREEADLMALITTLYPSFITYTQLTYCETLIVLLYWLILINIIKLEKTGKSSYGITALLISIVIYIVHQRNLGVLCATLLIVGYQSFQNKAHIMKKILAAGSAFLILSAAIWIKRNLSSLAWISQTVSGVNNYSDAVTKAGSIFDLRGIQELMVSVVGKVFYIASSSFLLVFVGVMFMADMVRQKRENDTRHSSAFAWAMLSFLFSVGIAAVFLIHSERMDILIYGRYSESAAGALILLGIFAIYQRRIHKKKVLVCIVGYCISFMIVAGCSGEFQGTELVSLTITGIYRMMCDGQDYVNAIYKVGLETNAIVTVGFLSGINGRCKRIRGILYLLLIGGVWIWNADCIMQGTILHSQELYKERILPIAEKVQENQDIERLVYVIEDRAVSDKDYADTNMNRLQYLLWDIPIERVEIGRLNMENYEKGTCFVLVTYADVYKKFQELYELEIIQKTAFMTLFYY